MLIWGFDRAIEAKDLIKSVPFETGALIWEALLVGVEIMENMDFGT